MGPPEGDRCSAAATEVADVTDVIDGADVNLPEV
jgi:hypothetical protein